MGCSDVGIDIIGIQEHRLITKEPTEELWSDDKNWVLVYSSATDQRQGGVGLLMSKHIYKCQSVTPVTKRIISGTFHGSKQLRYIKLFFFLNICVNSNNLRYISLKSEQF